MKLNTARLICIIATGAAIGGVTALWCDVQKDQARSSAAAWDRLGRIESEIMALQQARKITGLAEERVIDLPEDGNTWHTILILAPNWKRIPDERRAEAMFHSEPLLVSLKAQTHWHLITTDQPEFAKFRPLVNATPCLIVERANGEVVYRESGPQLGHREHNLTHVLRKEIQRHCPDGRCLPLHPVPGGDPVDQKDEIPAVLQVAPEPPQKKHSPLVPILAAAGAVAAGIGAQWKKSG